MKNKSRPCPTCGKELPEHSTKCECGYHEKLDDDELWRRIQYYGKRGELCIICLIVGVILFIVPIIVFIFTESLIVLLSVVGFAMAFYGISGFSKQHSRQSKLINDQLGEFFHEEYINVFGPYKRLTDTRPLRAEVESTGLYENWSDFSASQVIEGSYRGMFYRAANVSLWRYEERTTQDSDGETKTESVRVDVFEGIWIHVRQSKSVGSPVYVRERNLKWSGIYDTKEPRGRGNIELENAAFNEKYAISSDSRQDAFYVLTPQLMEQLEALDARAEGRTSVAFVGNGMFFGLETRYKFVDLSDAFAGELNSVADIKNTYRKNLQYTADILDIVGRNSFIERKESAVSSVK